MKIWDEGEMRRIVMVDVYFRIEGQISSAQLSYTNH